MDSFNGLGAPVTQSAVTESRTTGPPATEPLATTTESSTIGPPTTENPATTERATTGQPTTQQPGITTDGQSTDYDTTLTPDIDMEQTTTGEDALSESEDEGTTTFQFSLCTSKVIIVPYTLTLKVSSPLRNILYIALLEQQNLSEVVL